MAISIIMLRAIGPVTHRLMKMRQWREASLEAGFARADTYGATGNMIAETSLPVEEVKARTEAIVAGFGLGERHSVFVRTPDDLERVIAENPFAEAAKDRPADLTVCFTARPGDFTWIESHDGPERFFVSNGHVIVDYADGAVGSKVAPQVIERRSGITTTFRNWNTLCALAARSR